MKGFLSGMRFLIKYGAYVFVIIEILEFAYEKFETLHKKNQKDGSNAIQE